MKLGLGFFAILSLTTMWTSPAAERSKQKDDEASTVSRFLAAFNAHDVAGLTRLVTDDIEWLSVRGDEISTETKGRTALKNAMTAYFDSTPGVRSTHEASFESGDFVSVRERVYWGAKGRESSQAAIAVYELSDGKIRRVWYYRASK